MKAFTLAAVAALTLAAGSVQAQTSTTLKSLQSTAISDAHAAVEALETGDFALAAAHLELASKNASRLNIQNVSAKVLAAAPQISAKEIKYALAGSSTLSFDAFVAANRAGETAVTDEQGRTVAVRIFSGASALDSFKRAADDAAMLEKENLELASMAGGPAIKRHTANGGLSIIMMSGDDHALIELESGSEEAVMAMIEKLEE